jgi:hypothetical protein
MGCKHIKNKLTKLNFVMVMLNLNQVDRHSGCWIPLKKLKESPQIAEYAVAKGTDKEPAFSWLVPYTQMKMKAIVSAFKSRLKHTTH